MREGITLDGAITLYLDDLRIAGQASTARTYKSLLRRLAPYDDLTPDVCRAVLRETLATRSPGTAAVTWAALASLARWCASCGFLGANPMQGVPIPRRTPKPHRFLSRDELVRVYDACSDDRERLIVRLLLHGLRAGQLLAIRREDIRGDALTIRAQKRNPVHVVALDAETVRLLEKERPPQAGSERGVTGALPVELRPRGGDQLPLPASSGVRSAGLEPASFQRDLIIPLSYERLRTIIARIGRRARIKITAHTFRHTWASQALRAGMDSLTLQTAGGWADQEMVQHYTRSVRDEAALERQREIGIVGRLLDG